MGRAAVTRNGERGHDTTGASGEDFRRKLLNIQSQGISSSHSWNATRTQDTQATENERADSERERKSSRVMPRCMSTNKIPKVQTLQRRRMRSEDGCVVEKVEQQKVKRGEE